MHGDYCGWHSVNARFYILILKLQTKIIRDKSNYIHDATQDPVFLLYDNNMMWACLVPQGWVHRGESPPVSLAVIGDGG